MERNTHRPFFPRYEPLDDIGQGGMGTVRRVWDPISRRQLALKELRADAREDLDRQRFEREIRVLGSLHHEGIVRLIDAEPKRKAFTMELLSGAPLTAFLDGPLPGAGQITWLAGVVVKLLGAVDYLHRAGFLHRDLKAGNVIVLRSSERHSPVVTPADLYADPDPRVKLVDFGLCVRITDDNEVLHEPGTALSVAPERVDPSTPFDPRSDLYSLGVLLYQLLTHEYPFKTLAESLAPTRRAPRPPDEINPACPVEISRLVTLQLDRLPHRRAYSAGELRRQLIEAAGFTRRLSPRVLSPSFCGRSQDIERVETTIRQSEQSGKLLIVGGARGSGKTWLLHRSGLRVRSALDMERAWFAGHYENGGPLHQGLRRVLAAILLELNEDAKAELEEALDPGGAVLVDRLHISAFDSERLQRLVELLKPPAADMAPTALDRLAVESAVRVFQLAARRTPTVVILEDLQYADELDLEILRRLSTTLVGIPLTIICTHRTDQKTDRFDEWRHGLEGEPPPEFYQLQGLGDADVERMLSTMLESPGRPSRELVRSLTRETQGLPGIVEERLRDLWSQGAIGVDGGKWRLLAREGRAGKATVETDAPRQAFEELDASLRAILEAAATFEDVFDLRTLALLLDRQDDEGELATELRGIVDAGYLEESPDGFRFAAPTLKRRAATLCDEGRQRRHHVRLAEILLDHRHNGEESWPAAAHHFGLGGESEKAADYFLRFARWAGRRGAHARSLASFERVLSFLTENETRATVLEEKAQLHSQLGEFQPALRCLREAGASRSDPLARVSVMDSEGEILRRKGEFENAQAIFEQCRDIAGSDAHWAPKITQRLAGIHFLRGSLGAAAELYRECYEGYKRLDDHRGMAGALVGQCLIQKRRGELDAAIDSIERALLHGDATGERNEVARILHNLANLHRLRGDHARAIEYFERCLNIRESLGDRPGIAICLSNLSRTWGHRGDLRRALTAAEDALTIFKEVGDKLGVVISLGNAGTFHLFRGDLKRAAEVLRDGLSLARNVRHGQATAEILCSLGRLENSLGNPRSAERLVAEGLSELPDRSDEDIRVGCLVELVLTHLKFGNRESADDALRESREVAKVTADRQVVGRLRYAESVYHLEYEDLHAARVSAENAVDVLDAYGWRFDAAIAHRQLACVFRELGPDWVDRAEKHFQIARRALDEMESHFEVGRTLVEEAKLWLLLEEGDAAEELLSRAVGIFEQVGADVRAGEARGLLGTLG